MDYTMWYEAMTLPGVSSRKRDTASRILWSHRGECYAVHTSGYLGYQPGECTKCTGRCESLWYTRAKQRQFSTDKNRHHETPVIPEES